MYSVQYSFVVNSLVSAKLLKSYLKGMKIKYYIPTLRPRAARIRLFRRINTQNGALSSLPAGHR
jgi:hypothetical protein